MCDELSVMTDDVWPPGGGVRCAHTRARTQPRLVTPLTHSPPCTHTAPPHPTLPPTHRQVRNRQRAPQVPAQTAEHAAEAGRGRGGSGRGAGAGLPQGRRTWGREGGRALPGGLPPLSGLTAHYRSTPGLHSGTMNHMLLMYTSACMAGRCPLVLGFRLHEAWRLFVPPPLSSEHHLYDAIMLSFNI